MKLRSIVLRIYILTKEVRIRNERNTSLPRYKTRNYFLTPPFHLRNRNYKRAKKTKKRSEKQTILKCNKRDH